MHLSKDQENTLVCHALYLFAEAVGPRLQCYLTFPLLDQHLFLSSHGEYYGYSDINPEKETKQTCADPGSFARGGPTLTHLMHIFGK